ncbi:DNA polymerase III subunit beta [Solilutibacter tolerans]|uniref:Beta sliding clamp n=1 Tax=Solilutibacter tolerans TaxID=1604334 RepID=A0A1N6RF83_9GAMM|nr:DNA polymerase III subunit beta [Lysobacter tolerans]SIQ27548.1 DNA polymerase III, beta subunit [Lysobacter tolerans]
MRFSLQREALLKPLAQVVNVVERRQTLPVLANLLLQVEDARISLTGTDLEVEMIARAEAQDTEAGETTIPARKFFDIVRALPDGSKITVTQSGDKITVQAGRSRFSLSSLPANDFPSIDEVDATEHVQVPESSLKELIDRTAFAMAQQDVRYYLNGLLFDLRDSSLRCVATDGHRLALCEAPLEEGGQKRQIIVPRKGVQELQRLLEGGDRVLDLELGRSHIRVKRDDVTFTSKLIDGRFPDYEAVIPIGADKQVKVDREALRAALQRAAILSNEKYRGVRVEVSPGQMRIQTNNPEQEEAQEDVEAETKVDGLAIGFNVTYLLDALTALRDEQVILSMRDANSSALVQEAGNERSRHVVMPLRL